eukprot:4692338-Pleurochrysis_carterae.AAC.2
MTFAPLRRDRRTLAQRAKARARLPHWLRQEVCRIEARAPGVDAREVEHVVHDPVVRALRRERDRLALGVGRDEGDVRVGRRLGRHRPVRPAPKPLELDRRHGGDGGELRVRLGLLALLRSACFGDERGRFGRPAQRRFRARRFGGAAADARRAAQTAAKHAPELVHLLHGPLHKGRARGPRCWRRRARRRCGWRRGGGGLSARGSVVGGRRREDRVGGVLMSRTDPSSTGGNGSRNRVLARPEAVRSTRGSRLSFCAKLRGKYAEPDGDCDEAAQDCELSQVPRGEACGGGGCGTSRRNGAFVAAVDGGGGGGGDDGGGVGDGGDVGGGDGGGEGTLLPAVAVAARCGDRGGRVKGLGVSVSGVAADPRWVSTLRKPRSVGTARAALAALGVPSEEDDPGETTLSSNETRRGDHVGSAALATLSTLESGSRLRLLASERAGCDERRCTSLMLAPLPTLRPRPEASMLPPLAPLLPPTKPLLPATRPLLPPLKLLLPPSALLLHSPPLQPLPLTPSSRPESTLTPRSFGSSAESRSTAKSSHATPSSIS